MSVGGYVLPSFVLEVCTRFPIPMRERRSARNQRSAASAWGLGIAYPAGHAWGTSVRLRVTVRQQRDAGNDADSHSGYAATAVLSELSSNRCEVVIVGHRGASCARTRWDRRDQRSSRRVPARRNKIGNRMGPTRKLWRPR